MPDRWVLMGGAVGITARLDRMGPWTLVLLGNLDCGPLRGGEEGLHDWVRRVRDQGDHRLRAALVALQ